MLIGKDPQGVEIFYSDSSSETLPNFVNGVYSGQKYECVEYARRWYITQRGVTFRSVNNALSLLTLSSMTDGKKRYPVINAEDEYPLVGDIVLFRPSRENSYYGHVAIVVRVQGDRAYLGEQNYSSTRWENDYSRSIPIVNDRLFYPGIIGIKRLL